MAAPLRPRLLCSIALLGIGIGGLLYAAGRAPRQPTLLAFANSCGLEALRIVLPYAAGDRVALLTLMVQLPDSAAFVRVILGWVLVTTVVVLPAAVVAGYQFPLLVALLGKGERHIGRDVGSAYACNTLGAIAGSLAGGFGLLPLLSATGTWTAVVGLLSSLALASAWQGRLHGRGGFRRALPVATAGLAGILYTMPGPTAFWRQSPIGARRVTINLQHPNDVTRALHEVRRGTHLATRWGGKQRGTFSHQRLLELARLLVDVLAEPFAVRALDDDRLRTRASISLIPGLEDRCANALAALEPDVPWAREFLRERLRCYTRVGHPLEHRARADLQAFGS